MLITKMILPDGTVLSSGADAVNAIQSVKLTQSVNNTQELTLGSVCAAMLEATIFAPQLQLQAGMEVTVYKNDTCLGIFVLEKPKRTGTNILTITAYDRVSRLDQVLDHWLAGLVDWPYSMEKFAWMVCAQCGVELAESPIPNGNLPIHAFSAKGITGRQLMSWICQLAGRFCRANAQGQLELGWYGENSVTVGPDSSFELCYFARGLTYEDYQVQPIEKVQLRKTAQDVGAIWPDISEPVNTYVITANALLSQADAAKAVAQSLFEQLRQVSYTPCTLTVPATLQVRAGDILQVTTTQNQTLTMYVMRHTLSGQRSRLECTGSQRRDSIWAVNEKTYEALDGRMLELEMNQDGLRLENQDAAQKAAALQLQVDGISTQVSSLEGAARQLTRLEQTAQALQLQVQTLEAEGVSRVKTQTGYTFDEEGLCVSRSDSQLTNTVSHQGMYVIRHKDTSAEAVMLRADAQGVEAANVSVGNYLVVGSHARFEDYGDGLEKRTACYHLGG